MAMRVGPFSNKHVIDYLNRHFVPVFIANEDVLGGKRGAAERNLLVEIRRKAEAKGLSGGAVQVTLLTGDLEVLDVLHVAKAAYVQPFMKFLVRTSNLQRTSAGEPLVPPTTTEVPPPHTDDELLLQIRAQFADRETSYVHDWVVLRKSEWSQLLASPHDPQARDWSLDRRLAEKLLLRVYPYAADWNLDHEQIQLAEFHLRWLPGRTTKTIAIHGRIERIQNRHPGKSPTPLAVEVVGIVRAANNGRPQIVWTTYSADFGGRSFDALITSIATDETTAVER